MPIRRAILLAAGLGTRMRPLTEHIPKPLIKLAGRALIDYNLERLVAFGCERIVVNTHHHPQLLASHVRAFAAASAQRSRAQPSASSTEICLSPEHVLLESGGGIVNALPLLGSEPFFSVNADAFCIDGEQPALQRLAQGFDPRRMDALLLLVPLRNAVGYAGTGDFELDAAGRLRRADAPSYVFSGLQVLSPGLFESFSATPFSLRELYRAAQQPDRALARMYGIVHDADWIHVGTPAELAAAERYLARAI